MKREQFPFSFTARKLVKLNAPKIDMKSTFWFFKRVCQFIVCSFVFY